MPSFFTDTTLVTDGAPAGFNGITNPAGRFPLTDSLLVFSGTHFPNIFTKLGSVTNIGNVTGLEGWRGPALPNPEQSGFYYPVEVNCPVIEAEVRLRTIGDFFWLYLNLQEPESAERNQGYGLKVIRTSATEVEAAIWRFDTKGGLTELTKIVKASSAEGTFQKWAFANERGTLVVWHQPSTFEALLATEDSTYANGVCGISCNNFNVAVAVTVKNLVIAEYLPLLGGLTLEQGVTGIVRSNAKYPEGRSGPNEPTYIEPPIFVSNKIISAVPGTTLQLLEVKVKSIPVTQRYVGATITAILLKEYSNLLTNTIGPVTALVLRNPHILLQQGQGGKYRTPGGKYISTLVGADVLDSFIIEPARKIEARNIENAAKEFVSLSTIINPQTINEQSKQYTDPIVVASGHSLGFAVQFTPVTMDQAYSMTKQFQNFLELLFTYRYKLFMEHERVT